MVALVSLLSSAADNFAVFVLLAELDQKIFSRNRCLLSVKEVMQPNLTPVCFIWSEHCAGLNNTLDFRKHLCLVQIT